jgi:hypothetical protein
MQSLEPPYTFRPDKYLQPDMVPGTDNPYKDVFERSGFWAMSSNPNSNWEIPEIVSARGCDPRFNPFDPGDSLCMGTLKLEKMVKYGHAWISTHSAQLGFTDTGADTEKATVYANYVGGNMYTGFWLSKSRDPRGVTEAHPMCPSSFSNGECWTSAFADSRAVTPQYCADKEDGIECRNKQPHWEPPFYCYGATDPIKFTRECWDPFSYRPDPGANKMSYYYWFSNNCENSFCPYGKALNAALGQPMPATGNPYVLATPVNP